MKVYLHIDKHRPRKGIETEYSQGWRSLSSARKRGGKNDNQLVSIREKGDAKYGSTILCKTKQKPHTAPQKKKN